MRHMISLVVAGLIASMLSFPAIAAGVSTSAVGCGAVLCNSEANGTSVPTMSYPHKDLACLWFEQVGEQTVPIAFYGKDGQLLNPDPKNEAMVDAHGRKGIPASARVCRGKHFFRDAWTIKTCNHGRHAVISDRSVILRILAIGYTTHQTDVATICLMDAGACKQRLKAKHVLK